MVTVLNLSTGAEQTFSCSHRRAVMAAYAQAQDDWATWDYEKKYGKKVQKIESPGRITWTLGDFSALERKAG